MSIFTLFFFMFCFCLRCPIPLSGIAQRKVFCCLRVWEGVERAVEAYHLHKVGDGGGGYFPKKVNIVFTIRTCSKKRFCEEEKKKKRGEVR